MQCNDAKLSSSRALELVEAISQSPEAQRLASAHSHVDDQLKVFLRKGLHVYNELGAWAADFFVLESIKAFEASYLPQGGYSLQKNNQAKADLIPIFRQGRLLEMLEDSSPREPCAISPKAERLISFLEDQDHSNCSGLLFVEQRIMVSCLTALLSNHPKTKERFECATFVGQAGRSSKKFGLSELLDYKAQKHTLHQFRARRKNIVIATDALEEGIDVTACNLVICFDAPKNVKSFIQRRGRARQETSQFAIMCPADEDAMKIEAWKELEARLIEAYQQEKQKYEETTKLESEEEVVATILRVESSG
jgi:ERCC4-related helicase